MLIRFYGHFGAARSWRGRATAAYALALLGAFPAGVVFELRDLDDIAAGAYQEVAVPLAQRLREGASEATADVTVICESPLLAAKVRAADAGRYGAPRAVVAITGWAGINAPPEVGEALRAFKQVWTPSSASARALVAGGLPTACVVPVPYDDTLEWASPTVMAERARSAATRARYGFYWSGPWTALANPEGLIRAFAYAFQANEPVDLLLHSPMTGVEAFQRALTATGVPDIDQTMYVFSSALDLPAWPEMMDCYVTASRGEIWNPAAFDATLWRRHVISPRALGSDDYLLGKSATLVGSTYAPAYKLAIEPRTWDRPDARTTWREPDLLELAGALRSAYRRTARTLTLSPPDLAARFGASSVGPLMVNNLKEACADV